MNSLERITATVGFQRADRVPVIAQVFAHAAALAGVSVNDYVRNGRTLAQCQIHALQRYGYDSVFTVMGANVEAEALGAVLRYYENQYPAIERFALSQDEDWNDLVLPDPQRAGRMPEMLRAIDILKRELGNEVLIVGCVAGPLTLTTQLLGIETALYLAVDDGPRFERLMDFATDVIISFGEAQIRAGAHVPIVLEPSASPAVVPPAFFREMELPRLQRVCRAFSGAGAVANWLHIAGPTRPILPYYPSAGVHIANLDYYVTPAEAMSELPATCVDGNIKSLLFVEGTPEDIHAEATSLLDAFHDRGGFILSSGCEIPIEAAPANIAALVNAVRTR